MIYSCLMLFEWKADLMDGWNILKASNNNRRDYFFTRHCHVSGGLVCIAPMNNSQQA